MDVSIRDFGAVGDGVHDDAPTIRKALSHMPDGGRLFIPPGKYKLSSTVEFTKPISIFGTGAGGNPDAGGSWLLPSRDLLQHVLVFRGGAGGSIIRDIGFGYEQTLPTGNAPFIPIEHEHTLYFEASRILAENLFLFNCTRGILIANPNSSVGQIVLRHIQGQPLREGIRIHDAFDVVKVEDIHFWPFWSGNNEAVANYQKGNGEAVLSFRNDNPHFSQLFALNYKCGIVFSKDGGGVTSKFRINNADFDFCGTGIRIEGPGTSGQISNFTCQGDLGMPVGLIIEAPDVSVQASNVDIRNYSGNGIRVDGENSRLDLSLVSVSNWNLSKRGFPGIEALGGAVVFAPRTSKFVNGNGAPNTGGNVPLN